MWLELMILLIKEQISTESTFFCLWIIFIDVKSWRKDPFPFTNWSSGWQLRSDLSKPKDPKESEQLLSHVELVSELPKNSFPTRNFLWITDLCINPGVSYFCFFLKKKPVNYSTPNSQKSKIFYFARTR